MSEEYGHLPAPVMDALWEEFGRLGEAQSTLDAAERERGERKDPLAVLDLEREILEAKSDAVWGCIKRLERLYQGVVTDRIRSAEGLTERIRAIVEENHDVPPAVIRDLLHLSGFDLSVYSNPLATINGVLKRLAATDPNVWVAEEELAAFGAGYYCMFSDAKARIPKARITRVAYSKAE